MPIYDYVDDEGHTVEHIRSYGRRDEPTVCYCGRTMRRLEISPTHCPPDGVYSYAPNVGSADRFERQRAAIKSGTKVIERIANPPDSHRDGQLSPKNRE